MSVRGGGVLLHLAQNGVGALALHRRKKGRRPHHGVGVADEAKPQPQHDIEGGGVVEMTPRVPDA